MIMTYRDIAKTLNPKLMLVDGVTAVGVRKSGLIIYVAKKNPEVHQRIMDVLSEQDDAAILDVPYTVVESGEFTPAVAPTPNASNGYPDGYWE